jgi:hypothetical protein
MAEKETGLSIAAAIADAVTRALESGTIADAARVAAYEGARAGVTDALENYWRSPHPATKVWASAEDEAKFLSQLGYLRVSRVRGSSTAALKLLLALLMADPSQSKTRDRIGSVIAELRSRGETEQPPLFGETMHAAEKERGES